LDLLTRIARLQFKEPQAFIEDLHALVDDSELTIDKEESQEECLLGPTSSQPATAWSQDKPAGDFHFGFLDQNKRNSFNNNSVTQRNSAPPKFTVSMDGDQKNTQLPAASFSSARVKPLQPRKLSSQSHLARSQPESCNHNSHEGIPAEKPTFPPRTSSIRNHPTYCEPPASQHNATRTKTPLPHVNNESSAAANISGHCHDKISSDPRSTASNTDRPIVLSLPRYFSDTSSAIMGDFVPIDSPDMAGLTPDLDPADDRLRG
jgi:hypothetical protein